jgi:putative acetyltransferase
MGFRLALENPRQPEVVALIDALDAFQTVLYPPESHHGVDLDALGAPHVLFAVARDAEGAALGCGAVLLSPAHGELKRMYTLPTHRGRGIGKALLRFLEAEAQARGCPSMALETGYRQPEALGLYQRHGYVRGAPFGDYADDPNSVFMQKTVARDSSARIRDVSVWRATLADLCAVAPLFDAYRQYYGRAPDPKLATDFIRERLQRRESVVLLARDAAGLACGFTQLYPLFSSVRATRSYVLNDLFVDPGARRRGVGRLLLEAAARHAREEQVPRLKLSTAVDNLPAQRLYESLGWVRDTEFHEYNLNV